jgi:hypothetical protein
MSELRDDAREQGECTHANADGNGDLVRVKTLRRLLGWGGSVCAHTTYNASGRRSAEPDSSGKLPDQDEYQP